MMFTIWFIAVVSSILFVRWTWLILTTRSDWAGWVIEFTLIGTVAVSYGIIYAGGWASYVAQFTGG